MQRWGIRLQPVKMQSNKPERIRQQLAQIKALGLDYQDWIAIVYDEPAGKTPAALARYLAVARAIRQVDPKIRISFNPGESATIETFRVLAPFCDFWIPYALHLRYQHIAEKRKIYTAKPWMFYSTPCYHDKSPGLPREMYQQIRSVPGQPGNCVGTAFFASYYPWRDPWDTRYETIGDVSVMVLPSRHGPVATPTWEALREATQHANLARMVRERLAPGDNANTWHLVTNGSIAELLAWLERHPEK